MTTRYGLVLFDLDGTLLDTLADLSAAVNHAMRVHGHPCHSLETCRTMVGHGVRNLIWKALPEAFRGDDAYVDACLADFKAYYSAHIDRHTRPYPGIPDLLAGLDRAGVKLAVVSNKFQEGTDQLIREFFPDIRFSAILGNRPGHPLKPDPAIVEEALSGSAGMLDSLEADVDTTLADLEANTTEVPAVLDLAASILTDAANIMTETAAIAREAAEQEPERYGTAHYSENIGFAEGIRYFFKSILHSGANGTLYLDVPALLFLIIIVSAVLIVVIFIFSYMSYLARRRRRSRRRRRKNK